MRGMLNGTAVAVGLPVLNTMLNTNGTAFAATGEALPSCFGTWFWSLGLTPRIWEPTTTGSDYAMPEHIAVLNPIRDKINIYSGMQVFLDGKVNQNHYSGAQGQMTGFVAKNLGDYRESIDGTIGRQMSGTTRFRSLEVSCDGDSRAGWAARGENGRTPSEISPLAMYTRIFGDGFVDPNVAEFTPDPEVMVRHSVLSAVTEERKQLMSSVSQADRSRLDEYFTSVRDLERKLAFELERPAPLPACSAPDATSDDVGTLLPQIETTHSQFAQLIAHALSCGQTRIFNVSLGDAFSRVRAPGEPRGYHQLSHEEPIDPELGYQPRCKWLGEQSMGFFVDLVNALGSIREGDGSLLDRTAVFGYTDHGEARMHSMKRLPVLTAGTGGGRLKTGLHVAAEGDAATRVGFTLLRAYGVIADSWGTESNEVSRPFAEVLA